MDRVSYIVITTVQTLVACHPLGPAGVLQPSYHVVICIYFVIFIIVLELGVMRMVFVVFEVFLTCCTLHFDLICTVYSPYYYETIVKMFGVCKYFLAYVYGVMC